MKKKYNLNFSKGKRTHDELYLKENRHKKPKEMFKFILKNSLGEENFDKSLKILDVGCAAGEFLHYVKKKTSIDDLSGMDIRPELLNKAKGLLKHVKFYKKDVLKNNSFKISTFDTIFMIGVHPIFDDFKKPFNNLIKWTKKRGKLYICDMFNPYPVDVIIRYKLAKNNKSEQYETGWNNFSILSVSNFLKKNKKIKSFSFKKFDMPFDLKKNKSDPVRSWTIKEKKNTRLMTNGLCIIQNQILLTINLK
jgi:ubiquinone/menaquinone biosynthesis C-methylase UbiE